MMKKLFALTLSVMTLMLFCACGTVASDKNQPTDTTGSADKNTYMSIIDLLEGEIEQLRRDQQTNTAEYESKIAELEKQIAELIESSTGNNTAKPDEPSEPSPFTYSVNDGSAIITAYTGNYSVLVIPETLDGYPVTEIADSVFSGNTKLTSVHIPSGVKKIGWFAFSGCTSLKNVTLPKSLEEIGYDAFAYCSRLTLYCASGSYAERFANSYGIGCVSN